LCVTGLILPLACICFYLVYQLCISFDPILFPKSRFNGNCRQISPLLFSALVGMLLQRRLSGTPACVNGGRSRCWSRPVCQAQQTQQRIIVLDQAAHSQKGTIRQGVRQARQARTLLLTIVAHSTMHTKLVRHCASSGKRMKTGLSSRACCQ
jgi:hypothetical protein